MGWWATGHGDDIAGDGPADTVIEELSFYVETRAQKPSFQELLDALAVTLQMYGGAFLADPESYDAQPMEAVFEPPAPTLVTRENRAQLAVDADSLVSSLVSYLLPLFKKIAKQYLESEVDRRPRLSEILANLAFPLRSRPERLLRDAKGLELKEFRVCK